MKNVLETVRRRRWGAWNCAFYALLAVVGFISLNVAGCGGGGGTTTIKPKVSFTLQLRDLAGNVVDGSGTLTGGGTTTAFTTTNGSTVIPPVLPGEYNVTVTINGVTTTQKIAVANENNQTILLIPGIGGQGVLVTGRLLLNNDPDKPINGTCTNSNLTKPLTARVLIRARRVADNVLIQSFERPFQPESTPIDQQGRFAIVLPNGVYRIEVRQASPGTATETSAPFTGTSGIFQVPMSIPTVVTICVNQGLIGPGGTPTPTTTFTPVPTATPTLIGNPTSTPTPVGNPTATPLPVATATATATSRPTPTNTPGGPPPDPTFTPRPTNTPGGPVATNTPSGVATATPTGGPPPPPVFIRGRKR
jgi:hypothetical protein